MPKFYYVFGVERSGTRMLTEAIIEGGVEGDFGHKQQFYSTIENDVKWDNLPKNDVVIRTSILHAMKTPPIAKIITKAESLGYKIYPIMITRLHGGTSAGAEPCMSKTSKYLEQMLLSAARMKRIPITIQYEPFVMVPEYREFVFEKLFHLPVPVKMEFKNANKKYGMEV